MIGMLSAFTDPELIACRIERQRIIERMAAQLGCSSVQARRELDIFDAIECSAGIVVH